MSGRAGLQKVDHFGIAVPSIADALPLFVDLLGAEFVNGGDDPGLGIRTVQLRLPPGVRFELIMPATEDCYLHDYLAKRGPGFHHVTMMVDDLHAAIAELEASGYETVDTDESDPYWHQTYVRPRSGHGMLVQLVRSDVDWDRPAEDVTLDGVLAGEYVWQGDRAVRRDDLG